MLFAGVDWGVSVLDQAARRIFGDDAVPAKKFMDSFLAEKRRAQQDLPSASESHQTTTALVNWTIRTFIQAAKEDASIRERLARFGADSDRIESCWRYINNVKNQVDAAVNASHWRGQKLDTVDAVMEQLLGRLGLVAKQRDEGGFFLEPADVSVAVEPTGALAPIPLKLKKKTGGWPKGKKRSTAKAPERKAAAKVKPVKKKARRKSK